MARLGGLGRARRTRHLNADVNIINLVDVMLVLLIIFMVTAPILQGGIQVRLPKAIARPLDTPDAMIITVASNGKISVGDQKISFDQFRSMFSALIATKRPPSVVVRGDAGARWETIAQVLGVVRAAGIEKVGLPVEPVPNP